MRKILIFNKNKRKCNKPNPRKIISEINKAKTIHKDLGS
jgi:hypothetical protein